MKRKISAVLLLITLAVETAFALSPEDEQKQMEAIQNGILPASLPLEALDLIQEYAKSNPNEVSASKGNLALAGVTYVRDEIIVDDYFSIKYQDDQLIITNLDKQKAVTITRDGTISNSFGNTIEGFPIAVSIEETWHKSGTFDVNLKSQAALVRNNGRMNVSASKAIWVGRMAMTIGLSMSGPGDALTIDDNFEVSTGKIKYRFVEADKVDAPNFETTVKLAGYKPGAASKAVGYGFAPFGGSVRSSKAPGNTSQTLAEKEAELVKVEKLRQEAYDEFMELLNAGADTITVGIPGMRHAALKKKVDALKEEIARMKR